MIAVHVLLAIWLCANAVWSVLNWRHMKGNEATAANVNSLEAKAKGTLQRALKLIEDTTLKMEYRVCSVCKRIVARYSIDDDGVTTCINCAAMSSAPSTIFRSR